VNIGPLVELPPPWAGAGGETSFSVPLHSSCEERGGPLPILVAVAGLLSPPGSYLTPNLALSLGSLAFPPRSSRTPDLVVWGAKLLLSSFPLSAPLGPTRAPQPLLSIPCVCSPLLDRDPKGSRSLPVTQTSLQEPQISVQQKAPQYRFLLKSQKIGPSLFFLLFLFFFRSCKSGCYI
jgi:hypothetical protein